MVCNHVVVLFCLLVPAPFGVARAPPRTIYHFLLACGKCLRASCQCQVRVCICVCRVCVCVCQAVMERNRRARAFVEIPHTPTSPAHVCVLYMLDTFVYIWIYIFGQIYPSQFECTCAPSAREMRAFLCCGHMRAIERFCLICLCDIRTRVAYRSCARNANTRDTRDAPNRERSSPTCVRTCVRYVR